MAKTKRFMDGGFVPPNTYPFSNQNIPASDNSVKVGGRPEPLGNLVEDAEPVTMYKRGGKVKKYAEGGKADYAIPDARARAAMRKVKQDKEMEEMGQEYNRSLRSEGMEAPSSAASAPAKPPIKKAAGGCAKAYAGGGSVRGGGCEQRGKTKGRMM